MFGLTTLIFLARSTARLLTDDGLHKDDWTIISSYLPLIGATICIHIAAKSYGFGQDSYNLTTIQISSFLKVHTTPHKHAHHILIVASSRSTTPSLSSHIPSSSPPNSASYSSTSAFYPEKVSVKPTSLCWTFIALLLTTFLATELATIFQCIPIASTWDFVFGQEEELGKCLNITTLFRAISSLNLVYDMVLVFLPIPPLLARSSNISLGQKGEFMGLIW